MDRKSYFSLDLPEYFDFQPILNKLDHAIGGYKIHEIFYNHGLDKGAIIEARNPQNIEDVNYKFYHNKDGRFAWRPFQLIHPAMYVCLVHEITEQNNWKTITDRIKKIRSETPEIECFSIPISTINKPASTEKTVLNWWQKIEQRSIELSLNYGYMLNTDITNCYGSIYTHSIPWAIHDKEFIKSNLQYKGIGPSIDCAIRLMSNNQTNGIPQGSVVMDFIAEIVLAYSDLLLAQELKGEVQDYRILRYRDDYRIFTKTKEDAEIIGKVLSEVLGSLNLKLNEQKTRLSEEVISSSIKPDKWFWLESKQSSRNLQRYLLLIHSLASRYPNSGSLKRTLGKYYTAIKKKRRMSNVRSLISIIVDIALKNPAVYPICASILGKFFSFIKDREEIVNYMKSIMERLASIPNTDYLYIWLQRISFKTDDSISFDNPLCDNVQSLAKPIWNSSWLKDKYSRITNETSVVDRKILKRLPLLVPSKLITFSKEEWVS